MSGGTNLSTDKDPVRPPADSDTQSSQDVHGVARFLNGAINAGEYAIVTAEASPTVSLPVINFATQAELFPRPELSDDEQAFRSILRSVLPEKAPAIVSIINKIERGKDYFLVEGVMWDGTIVSLELVGRYRRGSKAELRWYAHPNEIQFGWEPGSKRWLRHTGDLRVVNTNRCSFQRINIAA